MGARDPGCSSGSDTGWLCHLDKSLPESGPQFLFLKIENCLFYSLRNFGAQVFRDSMRVDGLQGLGAVD